MAHPATVKLLSPVVRVAARRTELRWDARAVAKCPAAATYRDLTPRSLAFVALRQRRVAPSVNLVLPAYQPRSTFAGIKTALEVGAQLALTEDRPLRVVALRGGVRLNAQQSLREFVNGEFGLDRDRVSLVSPEGLTADGIAAEDCWIATYWTTTHAIDVACRLGVLERSRVLYLVQDHEPSFLPASTASSVAASTYHAGFELLVNSLPLADYLRRFESVPVLDEQVFAPSLDLGRLHQAQQQRVRTDVVTVLFYGRPSKPRNMFHLGVASVRAAAMRLRSQQVRFVSVGEHHTSVELAGGKVMPSVGTLSWSGYFDLLAKAHVVLALQASPHPSHVPLDTVVSGAVAVTNELGGTRQGIHNRLVAVDPDPDELATAITAAVEGHDPAPGAYAPELLGRMGLSLASATDAARSRLAL